MAWRLKQQTTSLTAKKEAIENYKDKPLLQLSGQKPREQHLEGSTNGVQTPVADEKEPKDAASPMKPRIPSAYIESPAKRAEEE